MPFVRASAAGTASAGYAMRPKTGGFFGAEDDGPVVPTKKKARAIDEMLAEIKSRETHFSAASYWRCLSRRGSRASLAFRRVARVAEGCPFFFCETALVSRRLRGFGATLEEEGSAPHYPPQQEDFATYESTNLYINNLAANVTEEKLRKIFGHYGEVFSIKVMWPRSEDERRRNRNKGAPTAQRRGLFLLLQKSADAGAIRRRLLER